MGDVVNLRTERKRRRREDDARRADENRVRHGLSKTEKVAGREERRRAESLLDGHRIERPDGKEPA